ncbi:MAG: hypothetical protein LIO87_06185, partial [Eubacterium sp.]|nr:hypothetical protein [Eubacterium sp.]
MSKINEAVFKIIVFMNVIPVTAFLLALLLHLIYWFFGCTFLETAEYLTLALPVIYCFFGFHIIDTTALIIYFVYNFKNFKIEEYIITYSLVFLISIVIDFIMTCLVYI